MRSLLKILETLVIYSKKVKSLEDSSRKIDVLLIIMK